MSLLDHVHEIAEELRWVPGYWLDAAIRRARSEVQAWGPVKRVAALAALDVLEARRAAVEPFGPPALLSAGVHLALEREGEARLAWLALQASDTERDTALAADVTAALGRKAADDAAWTGFRDAMLEILARAGAAAVPLLLTLA